MAFAYRMIKGYKIKRNIDTRWVNSSFLEIDGLNGLKKIKNPWKKEHVIISEALLMAIKI